MENIIDFSYSERISHNEQRIAELKGTLATVKLSINALKNENERCFEAMNNQTHVIDTDKTKKDKQILELNKTVNELQEKNKQLRKEKKQLKTELEYTKQKLKAQVNDLQYELVVRDNSNDDVILADNFGEKNIFEEFVGKPAKDILDKV